MPLLDAVQMDQFEQKKSQRKKNIKDLKQQKFDIGNDQQLRELQKYLNEFEFSVHKMYLFQSMSQLSKLWGGSWLWSMRLPIPEFVGSMLNYSLFIGVCGILLQSFSMTDFNQQLRDLQKLYKWCMKDGQDHYHPSIDNHDKLAHPDIQWMIELIGPFSEPQFMIAWDRVTENDNASSQSAFATLSNIYQSGASFFSPQTPRDQSREAKIMDLKTRTEQGQMTVGVTEGLKRAAEYFTSSPHFREFASKETMRLCQIPIQSLKDAVPDVLGTIMAAKSHQHTH